MKRVIPIVISMILLSSNQSNSQIVYPVTAKEKVVDTYFGIQVKEPYRWLENDTSAATSAWVKAQNKVTSSYLAQIPFRNELKKRLTALMNYPKYGAPFKKNGQYFFYKNNGLQNQSVLYRQATLTSEPEVLVDPNTFSTDGTVALHTQSFSKNGKYLAYSIARSGSDWNEIFVMEVATRQILADHIKWSKSSDIAWQGDGFYYSAYDAPEAGKEYSNKNEYEKVFYHAVGQMQSQDKLIYENKEFPLRECYPIVTEDEKYLFITETETTTGNELLFKDLTIPGSKFELFAPGFKNDYTVVNHVNGKIYILTNWEAPKQRLMEVDPRDHSQEHWKEIIPESENVLERTTIIGGKILAEYMKDAAHHAYGFDLTGKKLYEVRLPTLGTLSGFNGDKDDNEAFYIFNSYTVPPTVYRFNADKNTSEVFHKTEVKFNPDEYISEQVFYTSKDGTKVPMSIMYKKGMKKDGKNPLMLYGYGGFNISMNPSFSVVRIPFLENGGIYVVANIRGGGEYGEAWHLAGTKMHKQNVFDDFISAAEYLISKRYTSSNKLAIDGGSNGGLLVGACMTQRPDLYAVAIPEVGVLDMLRYNQFTIGWSWASDYGIAEESKEMFEYLKGYSPLHNVKPGTKYPATMVMTGDHDDRVVPAHSFKFAATLQAANAGTTPTLIRIDTKAGHGAGKPVGKVIEAQTDMWSFVMYNLGMNPKF
ncbi:MAG: prolyl oligopeptidase family serine peptidase [Bacteroidota bacterium]|nr:prolyl oligopeptidase family serine peptidase [Bacteroidota bacterium]